MSYKITVPPQSRKQGDDVPLKIKFPVPTGVPEFLQDVTAAKFIVVLGDTDIISIDATIGTPASTEIIVDISPELAAGEPNDYKAEIEFVKAGKTITTETFQYTIGKQLNGTP